MSHTPGPLTINGNSLKLPSGETVATVRAQWPELKILFSAAPEMMGFIRMIAADSFVPEEAIRRAKDLIARAEGGPPMTPRGRTPEKEGKP